MDENKSLSETHPEIAAQWHPTKNGSLTPNNFTAASREYVWWLNKEGREWAMRISNRVNGQGNQQYFDNAKTKRESVERQIASGEKKSLKEAYPELAAEWHPTKNAHLKRANGIDTLTPDWVLAGSHEKIWWLDKNGNEWNTSVSNRVKGYGAPLAANHPKVVSEWNPTHENAANQKISWRCENGHEWEAKIA